MRQQKLNLDENFDKEQDIHDSKVFPNWLLIIVTRKTKQNKKPWTLWWRNLVTFWLITGDIPSVPLSVTSQGGHHVIYAASGWNAEPKSNHEEKADTPNEGSRQTNEAVLLKNVNIMEKEARQALSKTTEGKETKQLHTIYGPRLDTHRREKCLCERQ